MTKRNYKDQRCGKQLIWGVLFCFLLVSDSLQQFIGDHSELTPKCGHDHVKVPQLEMTEEAKEAHRRSTQAAGARQPIRITYDYSNLDSAPEDKKVSVENLKRQLEMSKDFFAARLSVDRLTTSNVYMYEYDCLGAMTVPQQDRTAGVPDSDLHIYVVWNNDPNSGYVATAGPCYYYYGARPTFGGITFNLNYYYDFQVDNKAFQDQFQLALHEITHVLGFISWMYESFTNPQTGQPYGYDNRPVITQTIRGVETSVITTPKVVQYTREYFGCDSAVGMQLENNGAGGSVGSHWEKTLLYDEYMNPQMLDTKAYYSKFTFALLEDSGWYEVNYDAVETPYWGRGQGCVMLQSCDPTQIEFFKSGYQYQGCSADFRYAGYASTNSFLYEDGSDNICYFIPQYYGSTCDSPQTPGNYYEQQGFVYAENSRCFESQVQVDGQTYFDAQYKCHQHYCDANNNVWVIFDGEYYPCTPGGVCQVQKRGSNQRYQGTVQTPTHPEEFCSVQDPYCLNHCSQNGYCMDRVCYCLEEYAGADCSIYCVEGLVIDGVCQNTTSCPEGYTYDAIHRLCSSPNDLQCEKPCQYCTGTPTTCTSCVQNYYLNSSTSQCLQCSEILPNCSHCSSSSVCAECTYGYTPAEDGSSCIQCEYPCQSCADYQPSFCQSCIYELNRYADLDGECVCFSGYTPQQGTLVCKPDTYTCQLWMQGCIECLQYGSCIACGDGYFLNTQNVCVACDETNHRSAQTCECLEGYQENQNGQCSETPDQGDCPYPCNTCTGDVCESCLASSLRSAAPECQCLPGYYDDGSDCKSCPQECSSCVNQNECSGCIQGYFLVQSRCYSCSVYLLGCKSCGNYQQCDECVEGYELDGETRQCVQSGVCPYPCNTCTGQVCETCQNPGLRTSAPECSCLPGYYDSGVNCQQCMVSCSECNDAYSCTSCATGYFFRLAKCLLCSSYIEGCATCDIYYQCNECLDGYYLDQSTQLCAKCQHPCAMCNSASQCAACADDNRDINKNCQCKEGYVENENQVCVYQGSCLQGQYYDSQSNTCLNCLEGCKDCENITNCYTCFSGFVLVNQQCFSCTIYNSQGCISCSDLYTCTGCAMGYYQDNNNKCQLCNSACYTCENASSCSGCLGENRDTNNFCACKQQYAENESTGNCDYQCSGSLSLEVNYIDLNNMQFLATFSNANDMVAISSSYSNSYSYSACQLAFQSAFIGSFGQSPRCKVTKSGNQYEILVRVSYETTYNPAQDYVQLNTASLTKYSCDYSSYLQDISSYEGNFSTYTNQSTPTIPTNGVSYQQGCSSISFSIDTVQNDGKRSLKNINWQITASTNENDNLETINEALQQAGNNEYQLSVTLDSFTNDSTYTMKITYKNFLGVEGEHEFQFQIQGKAYISIELSNQSKSYEGALQVYEDDLLIFEFDYNACEALQDQLSSISYTYQLKARVVQSGEIIYSKSGTVSVPVYSLEYAPSFQQYGEDVQVDIVTDFNGQSTSYQLIYQVVKKPYTLKIIGGSRTIAGNIDTLVLQAQVIQREFGQDVLIGESQIDTVAWSSTDLSSQSETQTIDGEALVFASKSLTQSVDLTTLERGKAYKFKVQTDYNGVVKSTSVKITLQSNDDDTDDDLQDVERIDISDFIFQREVGLTENIYVQVVFKSNSAIQNNAYLYSLKLLYQDNPIGSKSYYYPSFSFNVVQVAQDVSALTSENALTVQITVQNVQNKKTYSESYVFNYRIPITQGTLTIAPSQGTSISTIFKMTATAFYDNNNNNNNESQSLRYRFLYKPSSSSSQVYALNSYASQGSLQTFLPYSESSAVVLVQVQDQYGFTVTAQTSVDVQQSGNVLTLVVAFYKLLQSESLFTQINYLTILFLEITQNPNLDVGLIKDIVTQIFDSLSSILSIQISYDFENTVMNILSSVLSAEGLCQYLSSSQVQNVISSISDIKSSELQQLVLQNVSSDYQVQVYQFANQLKNLNYLERVQNQLQLLDSALVCQQQQQQSSARRLAVEYDDQQLNQILDQIAQQANQFTLPDDDYLYYSGKYYKVYAQRMSYNRIKNFLFTDAENAFANTMTIDQLSTINSSLGNDFVDGDNNPNNVYSVQYVEYFANPFKNDASFPYQDQNVSVYNLDIRLQSADKTTSKHDIKFKTKYTVSQIFNYFQNASDKTKYVCIQLDEPNNEWHTQYCDTNALDEFVVCECSSLQVTTVVYDENGYYQSHSSNSQNKQEKSSHFQWIHVVIIAVFALQIVLSIYGYFLDKKSHNYPPNANTEKEKFPTEANEDMMAKNEQIPKQMSKLVPQKKSSSQEKQQQQEGNIIKMKKKISSNKEQNKTFPLCTQIQIFHMFLQIFFVFDDKISRVIRFQFYASKFIISIGLCVLVAKLVFYQTLLVMLGLCFVFSLYTRLMNESQSLFKCCSDGVFAAVATVVNGLVQVGFIVLAIALNEDLSSLQSDRYALACAVGIAVDVVVTQSIQAVLGYLIYKMLKKDFIYSRPVRNLIMIQQKIQ